jgi:hypothetical protein
VFVEIDTSQMDSLAVALERDRDTDRTQVVVQDGRAASLVAFPVPQATPSGIPSGTRRERRPRNVRKCTSDALPVPADDARRLDAVVAAYSARRLECVAVRAAYGPWVRAARSDPGSAFAADRVAVDREEQAVRVYARLSPRQASTRARRGHATGRTPAPSGAM